MINILILMMMIMMVSLLLLLINILISKKTYNDREKSSSYECGFDPLNATYEPFSIQFFLISIMFITFDIEIVILIPMVPSISHKNILWFMSSSLVILMLMAGLFLEWMENSIKWEK